MENLLRCKFKHYDCTACTEDGKCEALRDMRFKRQDCPFYKKKENKNDSTIVSE